MAKRFIRKFAENAPSTNYPRNAETFNRIEKGIDDVDNAIELQQAQIDGMNTSIEDVTGRVETAENAIGVLESEVDVATIDTQVGTFIHSTMADDYKVEIKIEGASYQLVTTQGANMAESVVYESAGLYGVTVYADVDLKPNTQYAMSVNIPSGDVYYGNEYLFKEFLVSGGTGSHIPFILTTNDTIDKSDWNQYSSSLGKWIIFKNSIATQSSGADSQLQIELGNVMTPYAPFVPNSPSPDYPAPITNAINFDAVACSKNVYNSNDPRSYGYGVSTYNGALYGDGSRDATGYIIVKSNTDYTFSHPQWGAWYDINKVYIGEITGATSHSPNNAAFMRYSIEKANVNVLQIEISSSTTAYEPYKSNKITIPYEMASLPNGVCDSIEKGVDNKWRYVQRVGKIVFNGSEDEGWSKDISFYTIIQGATGTWGVEEVICSHGKYQADKAYLNTEDGYIAIDANGKFYYSMTGRTLEEFKTWLALNPITVVYKLAVPVDTIVSDAVLTSYKGITNVFTTANHQVSLTAEFKSRLHNVTDILLNEISKLKQTIITMGGTI